MSARCRTAHARPRRATSTRRARCAPRSRPSSRPSRPATCRPRPLDALVAEYAGAVAEGRLTPGDPYAWDWERPDPLWPVAIAAVDLLRSPDRLARVKLCAQCSWLFVDRSRNGSRRWCSMGECGAQVKMRRYRAARRGG